MQHGRSLFAHKANISIKIIGSTTETFIFAVSFADIAKKLSLIVLIYNLSKCSTYLVIISGPLAFSQVLYLEFNELSNKFVYGTLSDVYFLGDYIFPSINLFQFEREPWHKSCNILYLVMSSVDDVSVTVFKMLISVHYPIYFYCTYADIPAPFHNTLSKSCFNFQTIKSSLQPLFDLMSCYTPTNTAYPETWYKLLNRCLLLNLIY